jgi:hypothetical protein
LNFQKNHVFISFSQKLSLTQSDTGRTQIPISYFSKVDSLKMTEQIHESIGQKQNVQDDIETKFGTTMIFSNVVSCRTCGMEMQFVEKDVIFGEDWYHSKCWQETQEDKHHV